MSCPAQSVQALPTLAGGKAGPRASSRAPEPEAVVEEVEPIEEEFDLSDIMSEELDASVVGSKAERLEQLMAEERQATAKAAEQAAEDAKAAKKKKKKKKSKKAGKKGSSGDEL